ncbi:MAG: LLM class flavin-dependent oxidoreductase, partial [Acidimicrobiia bacterium]|nr:LLM class flavin-dependent oxidoreductase [Acidimicrobiia bacterium]
FVEMSAFAEERGFSQIHLEEHHGAENGWSPAPLLMAGMVFARTKHIAVDIGALLVPQHDPVRLAEDIAVLDLVSGGGRLSITTGLGYRPSEYHLLSREWTRRGRLLDEALEIMLTAWKGEPFEYKGELVQVSPVPITEPHPTILIGGGSPAAARRAARFGLPFMPDGQFPDLQALYESELEAHGRTGFCIMPPERSEMVFVTDDPDRTWAELGHHFMTEAGTYQAWRKAGGVGKSSVTSSSSDLDELRAEGIYRAVTPDQLVTELADSPFPVAVLHPLVGGMPVDEGWRCMELFADEVLARLA